MKYTYKYVKLKETAFRLFITKGIRPVRVESICKEAGVSKMTFYKYFRNKYDILDRVMRDWSEEKLEEGRKILSGTDLIEERLIFFIKWKGEWIRDFSQDFLLELYQADSPVREMLTDIQTKSLTVMRDYFSQAMEQGKVNSDVSLEALMMWMNAMSVLFMDEGIKANFKSTEDMYKQLTSLYFYGITGKGKK